MKRGWSGPPDGMNGVSFVTKPRYLAVTMVVLRGSHCHWAETVLFFDFTP